MHYPRTERQARFVAVAEGLAASFAARAAEADRSGAFPHANYTELRAAGLPALVIPVEHGGWGATLLETVMALEALAVGDGSTALNVTMHMQTMGAAAEEGNWPPALFARLCREVVEKGALINSIASEPELGSPSRGGKPKTTATPIMGADGRPTEWVIEGRKSFASMVPALDYAILPATLQDGSGEVARFVTPVGPGFEIVETWDAMGMRSTGSHDVVLKGVRAPAEAMLVQGDGGKGAKVNPWFMLGVSAVYAGVAQAALETAARYAWERVPTALGKPIAEVEGIQRQLGQAAFALQQARLLVYHNAELWERYPEQRAQLAPLVQGAKVAATNHAVAAVDWCMRAVGGASMTRALPLERHYRDVRAGLSHPINDDQALILFGQQALREVQ